MGALTLWLEGRSWANGPDDGHLTATPDMELAWGWLERHDPGEREVVLTPEALALGLEEAARIASCAGNPLEPEASIREQLARLRVGPA